jgi:hypothetical protein
MGTLAVTGIELYPTGGSPSHLVMVQRSTAGATTNVPLAGTYGDGTPAGLEASWQGGAYTALTGATIAAGAWSATLPSQVKGYGVLAVRWTDDTAVTASVYLGVGDVFLVWGDSLTVSGPTNLGFNGDPMPGFTWYPPGPYWMLDNSSYQWATFMEQMAEDLGCPVVVINAGASGSNLISDWQPTQGQYEAAVTMVENTGVNAVRACLGHCSVNNVQPDGFSQPSTQDIIDGFAATAAGFAADLPGAPVTFVSMWADRNPDPFGGVTTVYRTQSDNIRSGMVQAYAAGTIKRGANMTGTLYSDHVHPTNANETEVAVVGRQWFAALKRVLYETTSVGGPRVSSVTINAPQTVVSVNFDQDFSTSLDTAVEGFRVMDDGTAVTIASQVVTGPRRVTLTLDAAITGVCTVSFASAEDAVGVTIPRSEAIALPDDTKGETDITVPPEPFFAHAVTDAPASGRFATVFSGVLR